MVASCETVQNQQIPLGYDKQMVINQYEVNDGDTITGLDPQGKTVRIRLTGIDAPENDQPAGQDSLKSLKQCLSGKPLIINWTKIDKYQRLLAKVISENKDCNLQQIKNGYAWHYKYFEADQPSIDRKHYAQAELNARSKKVGLWKSECPTPPWDWRRKRIIDCRK
ncbi:thermonuclease family protein [Acinetobacter indicus]|nr:thermonuclease family protein [Acinetobacter indicus]